MKTIGDLERWLKGAGKGYILKVAMERDKFNVHYALPNADGCYYIAPKSTTLEGAFDNLLEELRRKDNGAESMRTEKVPSVTVSFTPPANANNIQLAQASMNAILKSLGSAPVAAPAAPSVQTIICPQCGNVPDGLDITRQWACPRNHLWSSGLLIAGGVYQLIAGNFRLDGFDSQGWARWTHVP